MEKRWWKRINTVIDELIEQGFTELTDIRNLNNDADKLIRFWVL